MRPLQPGLALRRTATAALIDRYHFFNRQSQKINPEAIRANALIAMNGHISFSMGRGRATFIEKALITRLASMMATVQIVNFLMSWLRL